MPIGSKGSLVFAAGRGLAPRPMANSYVPFNQPARYTISGVTKDVNGAVLGNCTVDIYEASPGPGEPHGQLRATVVSDASGNYSVDVTSSETGLTFQAKAYLAGSPDVAGVTVNTLVGAPA